MTGDEWGIIGHERIVATLAGATATSPAHAYLLVGPPKVGKRTLAVTFAQALNCERTPVPCGTCWSCRQIVAGGHPDVSVVEATDGRDMIGIEHVRGLRNSAALRPYQSSWRVFIMAADRLTDEAADALLKTLEEPNPQVVVVLTATDLEGVPETIVSRCRVLTVPPVSSERIGRALEARGVDRERAQRISELARGAPGWACDAMSDPEMVAERESLVQRIAGLDALPPTERLFTVEELTRSAGSGARSGANRESARRYLEGMLEWWRDVLFVACGRHDLVTRRSMLDVLAAHARARSSGDVYDFLAAITTAIARVDANVDPRLACEALVLRL